MTQEQINTIMHEGKQYSDGMKDATEYIQKVINLGLTPPNGTFLLSKTITL